MNIPRQLIKELKEKQKEYSGAWIGYNANIDLYDIYLIPYSWCNSLLITKIELK